MDRSCPSLREGSPGSEKQKTRWEGSGEVRERWGGREKEKGGKRGRRKTEEREGGEGGKTRSGKREQESTEEDIRVLVTSFLSQRNYVYFCHL